MASEGGEGNSGNADAPTADNPSKAKFVTFKALALDKKQALEGEFAVTVRDMGAQRDVVSESKGSPTCVTTPANGGTTAALLRAYTRRRSVPFIEFDHAYALVALGV